MRRPSGFTLIELLVVIAIIALLVSILMPSLQKAKELAKDVVCMTNQRNVGLGLRYYAEDFENQLPPNTFTSSPGFWYFSWDMRIGRIPENALPPFGFFHVPPQREICTTGYVDYVWNEWEGDSFKCPTYWDQFTPKSGEYCWDETQSLHFSMNGALVPKWVLPKNEGTLTLTRFSDIEQNVILLSDCATRPLPTGTMPNYRHFYKTNRTAYSQWDIDRQGPWPWLKQIQLKHPSNYYRPADYYGHSGGKTNAQFVDGHVQGMATLKPADFNIN